jgi:hypothetical protein
LTLFFPSFSGDFKMNLYNKAKELIAEFTNRSFKKAGKASIAEDLRTDKGREIWKQWRNGDPRVSTTVDNAKASMKYFSPQSKQTYLVTLTTEGSSCTCQDHQKRGVPCKHIRALCGVVVTQKG